MDRKKALAAMSLGLLTIPLSVMSQTNLAISEPVVERPNIVVIITDDQDYDSMPVMRNLMSRPEGSWMNFTNAFVNHAVCCPSRATVLTGQYAHTHGAIGNDSCDNMDATTALPVWLDDAGYETAAIGKYLNGFPFDRETKPPGWDVFEGRSDKGNEDLMSDLAVQFIDDSTSPFFLYLAYGAPHRTANPPARYKTVDAYVPPDRPNFNEADFSDKPVQRRLLYPSEIALQRTERLNAQRELLAVDDGVQRVIDSLKNRGELDDTLIIFLSDHGYMWGGHREYRKLCPYEECIQIPMMVRYPGLGDSRDDDHFVSNVDLAATIADYAGITPRIPQDGRSFLPILNEASPDWEDVVLLERHNPPFYGIRTRDWKYIDHTGGSHKGLQELYDLVNDPYELENLANLPAYQSIQSQLAQQLEELLARPPVLPPVGTPTMTPTNTATPTPSYTPTPSSTPTDGPSPTPTETPVPSETPTHTATPTITPSPTPTSTPDPTLGPIVLVSSSSDGRVDGLPFGEEDILAYNGATGDWSILFDGSSFGLGSADIDGFHDQDGNYLLLSLDKPLVLPDLGLVDDSDIVRFVPDSQGDYSAGHYEWYFDGSAVELSSSSEDIDALSLLRDGRLLVSFARDGGRVTVNGESVRPKDEDVLVFTGQTGSVTAGSWDWYFDGSDIGLTTSSEDMNGISVSDSGDILYFTTYGTFRLKDKLKGLKNDITFCNLDPITGGGDRTCLGGASIMLRGNDIGFNNEIIDALQVIVP